MVRKIENSSVPPFLLKCYEMVDDQSTDALISWSPSDDSFVISDVSEFSSELLPKYFKHSNFSSFIRQLNIYGFRKIDTDRWEFASDGFLKGQKHLLKNISRRKQKGLVQQKPVMQKDNEIEACEENKEIDLWKQVESLKIDKNALTQELVKLRQHQQTSRSKMLIVREQLRGMEKNQQQMLSFIVMAMQNPGFFVHFLQPKENNWRVAEPGMNIVKHVIEDPEPVVPSEGMIVPYQAPMNESSQGLVYDLTPTSEEFEEFSLSTDEMEDLMMNIDFDFADEKLQSTENYGPMVISDLPDDDGMLEHLLSSPFSESNDYSKLDMEDPPEYGMDVESTSSGSQIEESSKFELVTEELEEFQNLNVEKPESKAQLHKSQNMEMLTKKMGVLAPESSLENEEPFSLILTNTGKSTDT